MPRPDRGLATLALFLLPAALGSAAEPGSGSRFELSYPAEKGPGPFDGRLLLLERTIDQGVPLAVVTNWRAILP